MNISVEVDSKALSSAMERAPLLVTLSLNRWISKTAFRAERVAKQELSDNTDTGRLQSSVRTNLGTLQAEVRPTAKHAIFVHEGRRPGSRMPPFGERTSLGSWAKRRGIPAFAVARSIAKKGIKADPFMDKTFRRIEPQANRDGQKLLNEIVRSI